MSFGSGSMQMNDSSLINPARRRVAAALALSPLAACTTPALIPTPDFVAGPAQPIALPKVRVGDRWRYEEINLYNSLVLGELTAQVAEASPLVRVQLTRSTGVPEADEIYSDPWRVVQEPSYGALQIFDAPVPLLPSRLVAGASDRLITDFRILDHSQRYFWKSYLDAVGWERIWVPAGEFDCLRVERRIWFTSPDQFRYFSERYDRIWYAPQINRWVQRDWSGSYLWAGRTRNRLREDSIRWRLLDYVPAPMA
jgi:hypothetical protein